MEYSKLREYAMEHLNQDIARNMQASGIDFSQFLAEYVGVCTGHQYMQILDREAFGTRLPLKLAEVQTRLTKELGKPVSFSESAKAGVAIVQIYDREELDKLDAFAEGLVEKLDAQHLGANDLAMQFFIKSQ